jgi:peroxiredoxin
LREALLDKEREFAKERMMLEPGDKAPDLNLRDSSGKMIALSSLWKRNPVVLAFLRHAG